MPASRDARPAPVRVMVALVALVVPALATAACDGPPGADTSGASTSGARTSEGRTSDGRTSGREVVIYASVDQPFAEPVLTDFEAASGIRVRAVYDVEASKTTGLVARLDAERDRPGADVWWSGEFAQTVELGRRGVLAPYRSPAAAPIPEAFKDPEGLWTGFGGRARVLLVNTERMPADRPTSVFDLPSANGDAGLAHPLFGTSATHAAALYAVLGPEAARRYYEDVAARGVRVLDGNSVVRDQVADGRLAYGITDTDDACGAVARGAPVELVFPDQGPTVHPAGAAYGAPTSPMGTLVVPNTVALVAGGPHPEDGRALVDYLLAESTTARLLADGWIQLPLRPVQTVAPCGDASGVRAMDVSLAEVARWIEPAREQLAEVFVR